MRRCIVDTYSHSVRQHVARQTTPTYSVGQSGLNRELHLGMAGAFGRHGIDGAAEKFVASRLFFHPDQKLINTHTFLRQSCHLAIIQYSRSSAKTRFTRLRVAFYRRRLSLCYRHHIVIMRRAAWSWTASNIP